MYYTYILLCSNGEYYKGCTNNIEDRLLRHQRGYVESTKELLPVINLPTQPLQTKVKRLNLRNTLRVVQAERF